MSTYIKLEKIQKDLHKEIERLNREIDTKIIKGLSYKTLAKRHRYLVEKLRSVNPQPIVSRGIMNRLAQYVSVFLM